MKTLKTSKMLKTKIRMVPINCCFMQTKFSLPSLTRTLFLQWTTYVLPLSPTVICSFRRSHAKKGLDISEDFYLKDLLYLTVILPDFSTERLLDLLSQFHPSVMNEDLVMLHIIRPIHIFSGLPDGYSGYYCNSL